MSNQYRDDLIDRLKNYKEQYMQDVDIEELHKHGVFELTDYLDGIQEEYNGIVYSCIVKHLVSKLSKQDIEYIETRLPFEVKIDTDNDDYYSIYDI